METSPEKDKANPSPNDLELGQLDKKDEEAIPKKEPSPLEEKVEPPPIELESGKLNKNDVEGKDKVEPSPLENKVDPSPLEAKVDPLPIELESGKPEKIDTEAVPETDKMNPSPVELESDKPEKIDTGAAPETDKMDPSPIELELGKPENIDMEVVPEKDKVDPSPVELKSGEPEKIDVEAVPEKNKVDPSSVELESGKPEKIDMEAVPEKDKVEPPSLEDKVDSSPIELESGKEEKIDMAAAPEKDKVDPSCIDLEKPDKNDLSADLSTEEENLNGSLTPFNVDDSPNPPFGFFKHSIIQSPIPPLDSFDHEEEIKDKDIVVDAEVLPIAKGDTTKENSQEKVDDAGEAKAESIVPIVAELESSEEDNPMDNHGAVVSEPAIPVDSTPESNKLIEPSKSTPGNVTPNAEIVTKPKSSEIKNPRGNRWVFDPNADPDSDSDSSPESDFKFTKMSEFIKGFVLPNAQELMELDSASDDDSSDEQQVLAEFEVDDEDPAKDQPVKKMSTNISGYIIPEIQEFLAACREDISDDEDDSGGASGATMEIGDSGTDSKISQEPLGRKTSLQDDLDQLIKSFTFPFEKVDEQSTTVPPKEDLSTVVENDMRTTSTAPEKPFEDCQVEEIVITGMSVDEMIKQITGNESGSPTKPESDIPVGEVKTAHETLKTVDENKDPGKGSPEPEGSISPKIRAMRRFSEQFALSALAVPESISTSQESPVNVDDEVAKILKDEDTGRFRLNVSPTLRSPDKKIHQTADAIVSNYRKSLSSLDIDMELISSMRNLKLNSTVDADTHDHEEEDFMSAKEDLDSLSDERDEFHNSLDHLPSEDVEESVETPKVDDVAETKTESLATTPELKKRVSFIYNKDDEEHFYARKILEDEFKEAEPKKHEESKTRLSLASVVAIPEATQNAMPEDKAVTVDLPPVALFTQPVKPMFKDDEGMDLFFGDYDEKSEPLDKKEEIKISKEIVDKVTNTPVPVRLSQGATSIVAQAQASPGFLNVSKNDSDASIVSYNDPEMENASPSVALGKITKFLKQSDFKLKINHLQQEVARLKAMNLQKDGEILKLEMEKHQIQKDSASICASDAASFYFKLQETENELKTVRNQLEHVSSNYEKVTKQLESGEVALSELSNMCKEMNLKYNRYKAYCMVVSDRLGKAKDVITAMKSNETLYKANIAALESRIEYFEQFKKEAVKTVSEANAFIDMMTDVGKSKDRKVLQPFNKQ